MVQLVGGQQMRTQESPCFLTQHLAAGRQPHLPQLRVHSRELQSLRFHERYADDRLGTRILDPAMITTGSLGDRNWGESRGICLFRL